MEIFKLLIETINLYKGGFIMDKYEEFLLDCEEIARECAKEGYPSNGSNYELRVEALMKSPYYADLFEEDE